MTEPRRCFYIPVDQFVEGKGYVPSLVTEGEPGHSPLVGQGELSEPWFWGMALETAERICREQNAKLGLTEDDVAEIVASSIGAQLRADGARARLDEKLGRR